MHRHIAKVIHFLIKEESKEIIMVKTVIMIGFVSAMTLPPETSMWVNIATNAVWLWRL